MQFSEYISLNISKTIEKSHELFPSKDKEIYKANSNIAQYEMILLTKPLIYCNSEQETFGENYSTLIH